MINKNVSTIALRPVFIQQYSFEYNGAYYIVILCAVKVFSDAVLACSKLETARIVKQLGDSVQKIMQVTGLAVTVN